MITNNLAGSTITSDPPSLEGEGPISPALLAEWLRTDQAARSLLRRFIAAQKGGLQSPHSPKKGDLSDIWGRMKDNYG